VSEFAATMGTAHYTEAQNRMILSAILPNRVIAERLGKSVRQIQRQRAFLKTQEAKGDEH